MWRFSLITLMGVLAVSIGACNPQAEEEVVVVPSPATPAPTTPAQTPAPAQPGAQQPATTQPFSPPVVAQQPAGTAPSNLIQSTNPDARVQQISQGRQDPFAVVPIQPIVELPPPSPRPPAAPRQVPQIPSAPAPRRGAATAPISAARAAAATVRGGGTAARAGGTTARTGGTTAARPGTTGTTARAANGTAGRNTPGATAATRTAARPGAAELTIPALPPLPQPNLAQAVQVTGVVQVGDMTRAIVRAPNETTSRYVSVGQRLSDGQILVKRIEMNRGSDPIVILEQYGVEVAKTVGEDAAPQPGTPGQPVS